METTIPIALQLSSLIALIYARKPRKFTILSTNLAKKDVAMPL
jgi:hypothetical protein